MKYEVYCDESCLEGIFDKNAHKHAVIGGVWIPATSRDEVKNKLKEIKHKHHVHGEIKWNKLTNTYINLYKEVIEYFFNSYNFRFRAIVINTDEINNEQYNNSSGELGFYKFYYQLIQHWLYEGNEYVCFLDHKINSNRHRLRELHRILSYSTNAKVINVQALHSHESLLIQVADILTGIIAAKFNNEIVTDGAKSKLIKYVEGFLGKEIVATGKGEQKFNIFNIHLRRGW